MEWYRWNTLEEAQNCLDYINNNERLPIVGKNSKTGEPEPDKQKTTRWADVTECADGKFGFPRIPEDILVSMEITPQEAVIFMSTYNPTIEEFNPAWIPEIEE